MEKSFMSKINLLKLRKHRNKIASQLGTLTNQIIVCTVVLGIAAVVFFVAYLVELNKPPHIEYVTIYQEIVEISEVEVNVIYYYKYRELLEDYGQLAERSSIERSLFEMLIYGLDSELHILEAFRETERRSRPLWRIYKNGMPIVALPKLQWLVYDIATYHDINLRMIQGIITLESTWDASAINRDGPWHGLTQISPDWLHGHWERIHLGPYRLTDDYQQRSLLYAKHNLITLVEMFEFFVSRGGYDRHCETTLNRFIWWHASGRTPTGFYGNGRTQQVWRFADEIKSYESEVAP